MVDETVAKQPDFALVVGVDAKTLPQLAHTYPTWVKWKPSLLERPLIVFYDWEQVKEVDIRAVVGVRALLYPWPGTKTTYPAGNGDKWSNPQRHKMLAGFVHIPPRFVRTPYWLKLDTDVVATGNDGWVDPMWFLGDPAIVAPSWHYTKPGNQMIKLDEWAYNVDLFRGTESLNLQPGPGDTRVSHKRICSWCAFFRTDFTREVQQAAQQSCPPGQLPVPSQDGLMWYCAKRRGELIRTVAMKHFGWSLATHKKIPELARYALEGSPLGVV